MRTIIRSIAVLAALSLGCSSSGEGSPARDAGTGDSSTGGSGGTQSNTGGTGGTSATGGAAGTSGAAGFPEPDGGGTEPLPSDCAPSELLFNCNPVTNEGCEAGEACDFGLDEYFVCYPGPNDVAEGGACNWEDGPFCESTFACDNADPQDPSGICRKYCCSDDDCESPKTCQTYDDEFGTLGVCK